MLDVWRSNVDGEEVARPKKWIAAREMNCSSTASKHSREPTTELGCAGREAVRARRTGAVRHRPEVGKQAVNLGCCDETLGQ
jgi:hypothetical protein